MKKISQFEKIIRERIKLEKPCVVGTRMATRLIKDGDLVEVNANHGVVKIIH